MDEEFVNGFEKVAISAGYAGKVVAGNMYKRFMGNSGKELKRLTSRQKASLTRKQKKRYAEQASNVIDMAKKRGKKYFDGFKKSFRSNSGTGLVSGGKSKQKAALRNTLERYQKEGFKSTKEQRKKLVDLM